MTSNTSYVQKEIFNLIHNIQSENELNEIKSLLIAYLSDKVVREANKAFDNKSYSTDVLEEWKNGHSRKHA